VGVLGRATALLLIAAGTLAGCSIDRIEWESTGFPVEEVTRDLEEKHHLRDPKVECIKREVGGAVWECRARTEHEEYECEVKVGPREAIRSLLCEAKGESEPEEGAEPRHEARA
jgi:hypothetical protein